MKEPILISRPWQPQDLLDDLQLLIDEEPDRYLNERRNTLCMAKSYLEAFFREYGCEGCRWFGVRHQKCSCCIRNIHMKDNYERRTTDV